MSDPHLSRYIQKARAKGLKDSEIKAKLKNVGWKDDIINQTLGHKNNDGLIPPTPMPSSTLLAAHGNNSQVLFFVGLAMIVCIVLIMGIILSMVPNSQQDKQYDRQRLADFSSIQSQIQTYYDENYSLPPSIHYLTSTPANIFQDPQTKQTYTYSQITNISYKLCTTFSTDTTLDTTRQRYTPENVIPGYVQHKKGYDCITYSVSYNFPTPTPATIPVRAPIVIFPTCINYHDDGSDIEIHWSDESVYGIPYLDVSTSSTFNNYYHKEVGGLTETTGEDLYNESLNLPLTFDPNTIYYVRYFDGQTESPVRQSYAPYACPQITKP